MHPSFFLAYEDIAALSVADAKALIAKIPRKAIGSVELRELCAMPDHPHGLYFLYGQSNQSWYVGKATSRSFIGRLSSHMDQRPDAWFNTVPRLIQKRYQSTGGTYANALSLALSLEVVLLGFRDPHRASHLEDVFRTVLAPLLNPGHRQVNEKAELQAL